MPELERTADTALKIVLDLWDAEVQRLDERTRGMLSESLLRDVFHVAWRHRFEEERKPARKEVRELVKDAIESEQLGEGR